jgi:tRNA pseudouridine55 synthase
VDDATTIEALEALEEAQRDALLLPVDALLQALPVVRQPADESGRFLSGLRRRTALADAAAVRVYGPEPRAFLGCAHVAAGELIPDRLLSPTELAAILDAPPSRGPAAPSTLQPERASTACANA